MILLLYTVHIIVCLFLILVILLQQGSGADLSVFGGGGTQTAFGARGATQVIHKLTVWGFVAFIVLTLAIAVLKGGSSGSSVMAGVETAEEAASEDVPPVAAEPSPASENGGEEAMPSSGEEAPALPAEDPGQSAGGSGDGKSGESAPDRE